MSDRSITYWAREGQLLVDHLVQTAELAALFASVIKCSTIARICGLLHDIGKYSKDFQSYLDRSIKGEKVVRGETVHALQGCSYIVGNLNCGVILSDIIGNIVASHHGGLMDMLVGDGIRSSISRTNVERNGKTIQTLCADIAQVEEANELLSRIESLMPVAKKELNDFIASCKTLTLSLESNKRNSSCKFYLQLAIRFLFSSLVDADRCNSAKIQPLNDVPDWDYMQKLLDKHLAMFENKTSITKARARFSCECLNAGSRKKGIYTLSLPTGAGKTLSSLRFALEHAKINKLKRIIYVIPYLSIIDQTAKGFKEIFGDEAEELILEHHSNLDVLNEQDDDEWVEHHKLLTSRWDSPIILTTMVQFLETIYSNKASDLRKFHNMSESVFIFDEIQALPLKCVHLFNMAINFLSSIGQSSTLLCTATQPALATVPCPINVCEKAEVLTLTDEEKTLFRRVNIVNQIAEPLTFDEIADLIKREIDKGKSTLVIMNTKKTAEGVFDACKDLVCEKAFLTTNLCALHRKDVIARMKSHLSKGKKVLCVSTQLIEAGVDISFDCVIRAEAGLDSIIQAAGRCNRHGTASKPQNVYIIDPADESLRGLPEIDEAKRIMNRLFDDMDDVQAEEAIQLYNHYLFGNSQAQTKMDYPVDQTTIYTQLSNDPLVRRYKFHNNQQTYTLPIAFKSASEAFSVIDGAHIGVIVPYKRVGEEESRVYQLISEFQEVAFDAKRRSKIMKELQQYSVTMYASNLKCICEAVTEIEHSFYMLSDPYYDEVKGLTHDFGTAHI